METRKLIVLSLVCLGVHGLPSQTGLSDTNLPIGRNTIFGDERLEGQIFEKVDAFNNIELNTTSEAVTQYRLPGTTRPIHYAILWAINFPQETTLPPTHSGRVDIHLHATRPNVNEIVIHSDELTIRTVRLLRNNAEVPIEEVKLDTNQLLKVRLASSLAYSTNPATPVIFILSIEFEGNLRDNMYGIYKSWYRNDQTAAIRWMASTQFQATAARWAFPCYDEPSYKATFSVTIRRPKDYDSWFCTRRVAGPSPETVPGFLDDVYLQTPIMSTYLLALIVAQYETLRVERQGLLVYEVIARPGALRTGQGEYALIVGQGLLDEMSKQTKYDFYDQSTNLKMTQAAIPDFGAGAMENWGLLTYREAYLMYDTRETNSHFKQIIANILSHEIAHMWYGNLVTCDWWDNLWLNEGFARYYQYFLTNAVETGMGFETRFIVEQVHSALLADAANSPHPLTNPGVNSNVAVSAMFSTISYNKGAAIIRMTEHLLTNAVFQAGLSEYLKQRAFSTALPSHLFQNLQDVGVRMGALTPYYPKFSLIDYLKSWTEQPGHPVLNVHVNHRTGDMIVHQRRFNINTGYSATGNNYIIPITFTTASSPDFSNTKATHIISEAITVINRGNTGDEWVLFNNKQSGFYRVNYDDYTWDLISIALRTSRTSIHEYNRAQIVNDVFQFARSGLMQYSRALSILSFLENETDYAPWVAAITGFNWLRNRLASNPTTAQLNQLDARIRDWSRTLMANLTYDPIANEHFLRSYLRYQIAPLLCNLGVQECITSATRQFAALRVSNTSVPVDSRNWVYCNGLREGGATEFDYLWNRFLSFNVYTEKMVILQSLGCTKHVDSLKKFLDAIVEHDTEIRPQDYNTALNSAVSGNEENTLVVLEYIKENLVKVASAFSYSVATPMSVVIARLRSRESINELMIWARQNQNVLGPAFNSVISNAQTALESISWAESVQTEINNYFVVGVPPPTTSTEGPPPTIVTELTQQPPLVQPVTPFLPSTPGSAVTSFLAITTIVIAFVFNIIL